MSYSNVKLMTATMQANSSCIRPDKLKNSVIKSMFCIRKTLKGSFYTVKFCLLRSQSRLKAIVCIIFRHLATT